MNIPRITKKSDQQEHIATGITVLTTVRRSRYYDEVEKHRTHTNKDDSEQFMGKDETRNQERSSVS